MQRGVATKDKVAKTLSNYTLKPYAKDIIKYLQDKDYQVAIITGGFIITAEHLANVLNVSHYVANTRLHFSDTGNFEKIISAGDENKMKPIHLAKMCNELDIEVTNCAVVGDGGNDLDLFRFTGHGITFNDSSSEMKDAAELTIGTLHDLRIIL